MINGLVRVPDRTAYIIKSGLFDDGYADRLIFFLLFKGSFFSLVGFLVFGVLSVGLGSFVWWWSFAAALVFGLFPLRGSVG